MKAILALIIIIALAGCVHTPKQIDTSEAGDAIDTYFKCVSYHTKKYLSVDMEPRDIANAAVGKCEKELSGVRSAIRKQADLSFDSGSKAWIQMMEYADSKSSDLRSKAMRKSIAYQADKMLQQASPPTPSAN